MGKKKFIWEEILEEPVIYRIHEAGRRENAYFFAAGEESLVVDPRSEEMLQSIKRLSGGLGAPAEKMQFFLTQESTYASMENIIKALSPGTVIYALLSGELEKTKSTEHSVFVTGITDGSKIRVGSKTLQCIRLEGHARGLTGLWFSEKGILFPGEAVGCDYLPDVPSWDSRIDTLRLQIETLRRLENLPVRLILPGQGESSGFEEEGDTDSPRISASCLLPLENMIGQYCVRLLETYQQIPPGGSITLEQLEKAVPGKRSGINRSETGCQEGPQQEENAAAPQNDPGMGDMAESCRKYLLYRKYIRQKEDANGQISFERGSMLLTDWNLQEEETEGKPLFVSRVFPDF